MKEQSPSPLGSWVFRPGHDALSLVALPAGILGLIPILANGPITLERMATAFALLAVPLAIQHHRWARSVSLSGSSLRRGWSTRNLDLAQTICLGEGNRRQRSNPYVAWLQLAEERWLVAENCNPAAVLEVAASLAQRLDIPLRPGWGLSDENAVWLANTSRLSVLPPTRTVPEADRADGLSWTEQPQQGQGAWVFWVALIAATLILGTITARRIAAHHPQPAVSVVLTLGLLAVFALLAATGRRPRWRGAIDGALRLSRHSLFGKKVSYHFDHARLSGAHRVRAGDQEHLLLVGDGCLAVLLGAGVSEQFADAVITWHSGASRSADARPSMRQSSPPKTVSTPAPR